MLLLPHAGRVHKGLSAAWPLYQVVRSASASLPLAFFLARLASGCHSEFRFVGRRISLWFGGIGRFGERFFAALRMTGSEGMIGRRERFFAALRMTGRKLVVWRERFFAALRMTGSEGMIGRGQGFFAALRIRVSTLEVCRLS